MQADNLFQAAASTHLCCVAGEKFPHKVLVVDDENLVLSIFVDLITRDGYEAEGVTTGEKALASAQRRLPCVMVLDLFMPGMDGLSLLRRLRSDPKLSNLSVIAMTGSDSASLIDQCVELGVSDFVHKPFDRAEMRFRIRNQLRLHEVQQRNRQLHQQLEAISAAAQDAIVVLNDSGEITFWNHAATRLLGYAEADALGRNLDSLGSQNRSCDSIWDVFAQFRRNGTKSANGKTLESLATGRNGEPFPIEVSLSASLLGERAYTVGVVRDISERKRAESRVRESEALQRNLFENLTTGVVIIDAKTRTIERMNRAAELLVRNKAQRLLGRSCHSSICSAPACACPVLDLGQKLDHTEIELQHSDGSRQPILKSVTVIEIGGQQKLLETFVDLSEQKLRDGLYRAIFEHSFDAVMTIHAKTRAFSSANPACLRLFGSPNEYDFLARAPSEYSPATQPDGKRSDLEYERMLNVALDAGHVTFDWTHQRIDGTLFEATVLLVRMRHCATTQLQVIVRDVSEQRRVEHQLEAEKLTRERMELEIRAAQKLEAIGRVASGIAHELNTPTQFASDSIRFLKEALDSQQKLVDRCRDLRSRYLCGEAPEALASEFERAEDELDLDYFREQGPAAADNAIDGLSRIASIVRAMKDFSHPDETEMALADVNLALRNTLMIARNEYKYVAEVDTDLGELPLVPCHLGALNQAFLNLVVNAAHAIADKVGDSGVLGRIGIRTTLETDWVRIDVQDTGIGIPESLRDRVFEPFFTTKEVGRGTGQGLAIARSIVCGRHGGTIGFVTIEGVGTTFTVRIPLKAQSA